MFRKLAWGLGLIFVAGALAAGVALSDLPGGIEPACAQGAACRENYCTGNCVAYQYFTSKSLTPWIAWYDSAWTLTGCDDPAWQVYAQWMLDLVGEFVGAPGGATMNCHQMVGGQATVCGSQCETNPCRYAPNAAVSFPVCAEGSVTVMVDNDAHLDSAPESEPSAYTREFPLQLWLSRDGGQELLVGSDQAPSLSYSNWITNGGYDQCVAEYGSDRPCNLLEPFVKPAYVSYDYAWGNGLYNLDGYTSSSSGMDSAPSDGYIALKSDGDRVTIDQGNFSGWLYVRNHNLESGALSESVSAWNAANGSQTFENGECNCRVCWCNLVGTRRDVDTYVIATGGDVALRLDGEYTLTARASLDHDKDSNDNTAACTLSLYGPPADDSGATGDPTPTPTPGLDAQIITAGAHHFDPADATDHLYALQVPQGLAGVRIALDHPDVTAGNYDLLVNLGSPPAPYTADCISDNDGGYADSCRFDAPQAGWYYILVQHDWGAGAFDLTITFEQRTPTATPTLPTTGGSRDSASEVENNDTRQSANPWDGLGPIEGQLATHGDNDYFRWAAGESGVYTLLLEQVPANIRADVFVYREGSTSAVQYDTTQPAGSPVSLTFDANAGQAFIFRVKATSSTEISSQPYQLSLAALPDPYEPDDAYGNARIWNDLSAAQAGYFWEVVSGPADFYTLTAPHSALITVELSGVDASVRPDLAVYDSHPNIILSDTSQPAGGSVTLTFDANAGEVFFVKVQPTNRLETSLQPYTLNAALTSDPYEPDDTRGQARDWDYAAGPAQGYFWETASGEGDYLRITTPTFSGVQDLAVVLEEVDASVSANLYVYNAGGHVIESTTDAQAGENVRVIFTASGSTVYFIRVKPDSRLETSARPYRLSVAQVVR